MGKNTFIPPMPYVDPPNKETIENLHNMTKQEHRALRRSDEYKKLVQPMLDSRELQKKRKRKDWWKNNWISFLGLVFAFIAAIPVIIQGIIAILEMLG